MVDDSVSERAHSAAAALEGDLLVVEADDEAAPAAVDSDNAVAALLGNDRVGGHARDDERVAEKRNAAVENVCAPGQEGIREYRELALPTVEARSGRPDAAVGAEDGAAGDAPNELVSEAKKRHRK